MAPIFDFRHYGCKTVTFTFEGEGFDVIVKAQNRKAAKAIRRKAKSLGRTIGEHMREEMLTPLILAPLEAEDLEEAAV